MGKMRENMHFLAFLVEGMMKRRFDAIQDFGDALLQVFVFANVFIRGGQNGVQDQVKVKV